MMARDPDNRRRGSPARPGGRAERLAAALKENLKRRKAQARGRATAGDERPAAPPDGTGERPKGGENQ